MHAGEVAEAGMHRSPLAVGAHGIQLGRRNVGPAWAAANAVCEFGNSTQPSATSITGHVEPFGERQRQDMVLGVAAVEPRVGRRRRRGAMVHLAKRLGHVAARPIDGRRRQEFAAEKHGAVVTVGGSSECRSSSVIRQPGGKSYMRSRAWSSIVISSVVSTMRKRFLRLRAAGRQQETLLRIGRDVVLSRPHEVADAADAEYVAHELVPLAVPGEEDRAAVGVAVELADGVQLAGVQVHLALEIAVGPIEVHEVRSGLAAKADSQGLVALARPAVGRQAAGDAPSVAEPCGNPRTIGHAVRVAGRVLLVLVADERDAEERMAARSGAHRNTPRPGQSAAIDGPLAGSSFTFAMARVAYLAASYAIVALAASAGRYAHQPSGRATTISARPSPSTSAATDWSASADGSRATVAHFHAHAARRQHETLPGDAEQVRDTLGIRLHGHHMASRGLANSSKPGAGVRAPSAVVGEHDMRANVVQDRKVKVAVAVKVGGYDLARRPGVQLQRELLRGRLEAEAGQRAGRRPFARGRRRALERVEGTDIEQQFGRRGP